MGCNCCCSTDKEKDKKPEEKPVDPKVEEHKIHSKTPQDPFKILRLFLFEPV